MPLDDLETRSSQSGGMTGCHPAFFGLILVLGKQ
jgi:hypothetical protein